MTIRDELQAAARRGCALLAPSAVDAIEQFLPLLGATDGGFRGSGAQSDLYYTLFGYQCLEALDLHWDIPFHEPAAHRLYLERCWSDQRLDLIHLACLARCWVTLASFEGVGIPSALAGEILNRIESCRSRDGGYAQVLNSPTGSAYDAFLALGAYQDLGRPLPSPELLAEAVEKLASPEGGYTNSPLIPIANVPATAAAMIVLRHLGRPVEARHMEWLAGQCRTSGELGQKGFVAWEGAPQPDLLSTAVALHALKCAGAPLEYVREACDKLVHVACWHVGGAFRSTWGDDAMMDTEYLYYGLLACGSLAQ